MGWRVEVLERSIWGVRYRVWDVGCGVKGVRCGVQDEGCTVYGVGSRITGKRASISVRNPFQIGEPDCWDFRI